MKTYRIAKVNLEGVQIEFAISGEANTETILFLHGLGANISQFRAQHIHFGKKFKVISVNLRGHGNSRILNESGISDFSLVKMAKDIVGLLDELTLEKIHFVGNSIGGTIGYELLKIAPERVKSFVTFGATAKLKTSKLTLRFLKLFYTLLDIKSIAFLSKLAGRTPASKMTIKKMMVEADKRTILRLLPHLSNFDYLNVIQKTNVPAMIIKGEKDSDINKVIDTTLAKFESRSNFTLKEMKNTGHFANLDDPILFNYILEVFICERHSVNN